MWEGLIILGLAAISSVTLITFWALDTAKELSAPDVREDVNRLAIRSMTIEEELHRKQPIETLCKNCRHRSKHSFDSPDRDVCRASPSDDPHPVTGDHERFYLCKNVNKDKRCPKFLHR